MTGKREADTSKKTWRAWDDIYRRQPRTWRGPADKLDLDVVPKTVLELGCGSGKTLRSLGDADVVVALDISIHALRACRREAIPENSNLVMANALRLPIAASTIDVVIAHHILGHMSSDERPVAASEIARALRPGGILTVKVMSRDDMRFGGGRELEPGTFSKGDVFCHFFDEDEVKSLFPSFAAMSVRTTHVKRRYGGSERTRSEVVALLRSPA